MLAPLKSGLNLILNTSETSAETDKSWIWVFQNEVIDSNLNTTAFEERGPTKILLKRISGVINSY